MTRLTEMQNRPFEEQRARYMCEDRKQETERSFKSEDEASDYKIRIESLIVGIDRFIDKHMTRAKIDPSDFMPFDVINVEEYLTDVSNHERAIENRTALINGLIGIFSEDSRLQNVCRYDDFVDACKRIYHAKKMLIVSFRSLKANFSNPHSMLEYMARQGFCVDVIEGIGEYKEKITKMEGSKVVGTTFTFR